MKNAIAWIIGNFLNLVSYISISLGSKWALDLFSNPLKGRITKPYPILEMAKKVTLYFQDIDIATYNWEGTGNTVLLAHGWESNSGRWKNTINSLKENNFNIICLDAPAHGASGSKSFNAVLYSKFIAVVCERFKPSILIGHSVGCMAISFFLKNSNYNNCEKLVFLGSPAGFSGIFKNYIYFMGYNKRLICGMELKIKERFGFPSSHFNTSKFIEGMDIETLIIHDKNDPVIPYSDALEIKSSLKNCELFTTNGLGHGLKSRIVIETISKFIEE